MADWKTMKLIGLDTETTGLSLEEDRVFEVGLVIFEAGEKIEEWGQLLNPQRPLSEDSRRKTGITDKDLEGKPLFKDVAQEILERIKDGVLVGYNLLFFDLPILAAEMRRVGLDMPQRPAIDVLVLARGLVKQGRHSLQDMLARYALTAETAHRATADAEATIRLLFAMAPELPSDLDDLLEVQRAWADEYRIKRASWRKRKAEKDDLVLQPEAPRAEITDGKIRLGPAYLYGLEPDPIRAFLSMYLTGGRPG